MHPDPSKLQKYLYFAKFLNRGIRAFIYYTTVRFQWSFYKNWKWAEFFPRMWLINMMKVLRASRKISALSSLDGTRKGSLRPAKQIFPFGKICAISFPLLPVLRLPRDRCILFKIPNSLKYFHFYFMNLRILAVSLHVPFGLGYVYVASRTTLDRNGQESTRQVVKQLVCQVIIGRSHRKRCQERRSEKPNYDFTYNHFGSDEEWRLGEDAAIFYT